MPPARRNYVPGNPPLKAGRTNGRACERCHRRKVRCDVLEKGTPCSNCESHGIVDCQVFEKKKTRSSVTRGAAVLQPKPQRRHPATAPTTPTPTILQPDALGFPAPRPRSSATERCPSICDATEQATRNLADFINREDLRHQEITHRCRLYFIGTEFSNLHHVVQQRSRWPGQSVLHFGSHTFPAKVPTMAPEILELPEKGLADELVGAYFVHVNRGFPIVDETEFMNSYLGIVSPGAPGIKPVSLLLLNAIFLAGAHVLAPQREDIKVLRPTFFERTKTIFDRRYEKHREAYLQAALLLTWQCEDLEDVVSNSWHWVGVAARTAFGLGMHRDANPSNLNISDKRLWVRLWWILFQFDVVVSTAYGRPQAINLDESDVPMLEEQHFEAISDAHVAFTIHHTRLCLIFAKAMRRRVALRSTAEDRAAATREADEELAEFLAQLPPQLLVSPGSSDVWNATLHLSYNNFLVLLHRRRDSDRSFRDVSSDSSICWDAVKAISSTFESLRISSKLCRLWLPSIHVLFTAMVHLSSHLNDSNPLIAGKARPPFESLLLTLHDLAEHWVYAQSLLALFEARNVRSIAHFDESVRRSEGARRIHRHPSPFQSDNYDIRDNGAPAEELRGFMSMRPVPLTTGQETPSEQDVSRPSGLAQLAREGPQEQPIYGGFFGGGGELGLSDSLNSMDTLPLPSELEFLLAGVGSDFEF